MDIISCFKQKVSGKGLSVVFPEGNDERIIRAARILKDDGIAEPILLARPEQTKVATENAGFSLDGVRTVDPGHSDKLDAYVEKYIEGRDNISPFYSGMMVACGDADAAVGGVASATSTLIQAATLTIGLAAGIKTVSSYFLMIIPRFLGQRDKPFIFADCAVNIDPTAEQLADIAIASAASARRILDTEPKVAMLSFSTKGSASAPSVDKVEQAIEIVRARQPDLAIDGEFQADTAIVPSVAAKKVKEKSSVAGNANVIVFPNLDSGNIAYKLVQYMANAQAVGPFLQGFAKPIGDLSRGAGVDDIVSTTVLTLAQLL